MQVRISTDTPAVLCHCRSMAALAELTLEESDIEGACLEEPLETHTIPKLRWWLVCHGRDAPSSDKKPALIARYTRH